MDSVTALAPVPVKELGLKLAVTPAGKPAIERVTTSENEGAPKTVVAREPVAPGDSTTVDDAGKTENAETAAVRLTLSKAAVFDEPSAAPASIHPAYTVLL